MDVKTEIQTTELQLSKASTPDTIKAYFQKVLELTKSGKQFPVDLDDVWPLVYERKDNAVKALENFAVQNIDYQVFRQNAENPLGGRPEEKYYLSVPMLEFFIARKIRPVFEVYRQVFHKTVNAAQKPVSHTRNIIPGLHSPKMIMLEGRPVWTLLHDGRLYYRLNDILKAANVYRSRCKASSFAWFQPYVFWFNDQAGYKSRRYCAEDGIVIFFSRIKPVRNYTHLPMFLKNFALQTGIPKKIVAAKVETEKTSIDMEKFMDIIVNTQDSDNRNFLYETYKKLGGLKS